MSIILFRSYLKYQITLHVNVESVRDRAINMREDSKTERLPNTSLVTRSNIFETAAAPSKGGKVCRRTRVLFPLLA